VGKNDPKRFIKFWDDERDLILERNNMGFRAADAGPLTLGYRLDTTRSGSITRRLIYPKGAYVLHMVRMMMWDQKTGDAPFREFMKDFVKTYQNKAVSTEDFKAVLERHMNPDMNLDNNNKMDWFFNEWVYGTALPRYNLQYTADKSPDGYALKLKLTQAEVGPNFKMLVPVYLELKNGKVVRLGAMPMQGSTTVDQGVDLPGLNEAPKRVLLNYYDDVLAAKD